MPADGALALLERGMLTVEGRITRASNATLYSRVELDGLVAACVYKPVSGERPLWDFPDGTLAEREVAAHLVSVATGWNIVPPTVLRDGPLGPGMAQLWIADDPTFDYVSAINAGDVEGLRRMALFDAVVNNSDRKVSHLLAVRATAGAHHLYGVDHGVTFSVDDKLRTVLWQWAGSAIPEDGLVVLSRLDALLRGQLGEALAELLTTAEVAATRRRVAELLSTGLFPLPPTDWPAVPYPPY